MTTKSVSSTNGLATQPTSTTTASSKSTANGPEKGQAVSVTSPTSKAGKTMAKAKSPVKKSETAKKKSAKVAKSAKGSVAPVDKMLEENEHLKNAVQQIEAQFGSGSIMALGNDSNQKIRGISTGSLSLDMALGGSGLPCGRVIEVYGPESSGKTTLALHAIAESQKNGGIAAIVDAEHAFDPTWGKKVGVSLDTLLVSQPSSGEEAMQIVEMLIKSNAVDMNIC